MPIGGDDHDRIDISTAGNPQIIAFAAVLIGIVLAIIILSLTGYYTGTESQPVKDVGTSSLTGSATVILAVCAPTSIPSSAMIL